MSNARAYYNEFDPYAAQWLRNLIAKGLLPDGEVDSRSIVDVQPDDLRGFVQCHFFAGIGGWAYAARLAGWPDDRPLWTGSCPCQPFSSAARGRNKRTDDERHLWPAWRRLIAARRPPKIFGEQVAHASDWLDGVCNDMESENYSVWASFLPAYSVEADHARERIYFVCDANGDGESSLSLDAEMVGLSRRRSDAGNMVQKDGLPSRVAVLRAFGNAIVPPLAAQVIGALLDAEILKKRSSDNV